MGTKPINNDRRFMVNIEAWKYYLRFYHGYESKMIVSVVVSITQSIFVLPIAFLVQYEIDELIPSASYTLMMLVGIIIVGLYLISGGLTLWTRYLILDISKSAIQQFRDELLKKFFALSRSYYSQADRSKLHAIMVQDTERLDVMTNAVFSQLLPGFFTTLMLSIILVYLNWYLFLILIIAMPLMFIVSKTIGRRVRVRAYAFHRSFETFSQGILFMLQMMDLTRIQSAEEIEINRQRKHFEDLRLTSGQMAWLRSAHNLVHTTIIAVAGVIILIVGGYAVSVDYMTLGELLSFTAVVALLRPQLQNVTNSIPMVIEGTESLNSLYKHIITSDKRPYSGSRLAVFQGKIAFEMVDFQYQDLPTLVGVTFTIDPGEMIALVGPNGSGKTTITNLILGFYRPQHGQLLADDIPYDKLDIVNLRREIGVVTQTPTMFQGSVWENLTYGCKSVSQEEVEKAAKFASAQGFIEELPEGYDTRVGEHGVLLSGGQCQRIAIARAILRQPKLLILDEPTNHLDAAAVSSLLINLRNLDTNPACIVISHDLNVAKQADQILQMEDGRLVDGLSVLVESDNLGANLRSVDRE